VSYVALHEAEPDYLAADEAELIATGLPYLQPVWSNDDWRLYRVRDPQPVGASALGVDWFEVEAPAAGAVEVRVRFTSMWSVTGGAACVSEGEEGWTTVDPESAGTVRVQARLFGSSCSE
jgi:hypothetical protein